MTNQELIELFKSAGFDTKIFNDSVIVSLNRPVDFSELEFILGHETRNLMFRISRNQIGIVGAE